jgi:lipopolysaccharide transport system ATP-binding protein
MKPIIEVNHVWKEYQKGIDRKYKSLRDTISQIPELLWGNKTEKFWALEDIDFKVEVGESIGIIGRNGAGKSTLLKILSRITPPTKGEVIMRGRVASLLEVGTGFHPELTGKENIFFNGSILGMKHREIKQKFDEIVDFSGVQSFIDTPLKHYSSGMQMRLAFSVAAHLDSEILLIDEVLAVGDAEFQKKCIGKMDEVSKSEGKTILFVSHDLNKVINLCSKSCLLKYGKLDSFDLTSLTLSKYEENTKALLISSKYYLKDSKNILEIEILNTFINIVLKKNDFRNFHLMLGFNDIYGNRIFNLIKENCSNKKETNTTPVSFDLSKNKYISSKNYNIKIVLLDNLYNIIEQDDIDIFLPQKNEINTYGKFYGNLTLKE